MGNLDKNESQQPNIEQKRGRIAQFFRKQCKDNNQGATFLTGGEFAEPEPKSKVGLIIKEFKSVHSLSKFKKLDDEEKTSLKALKELVRIDSNVLKRELSPEEYFSRLYQLWQNQNMIKSIKIRKWAQTDTLRTSYPDCVLRQRYFTGNQYRTFMVSNSGNYYFFKSGLNLKAIRELYENPAQIVNILDCVEPSELPYIIDVVKESLQRKLNFHKTNDDFVIRFANNLNAILAEKFEYNQSYFPDQTIESSVELVGGGFVPQRNSFSEGESFLYNYQKREELRRFKQINRYFNSKRFAYSSDYSSAYQGALRSKQIHRDFLPANSYENNRNVGSARSGYIFSEKFCMDFFKFSHLPKEVKYDFNTIRGTNDRTKEYISSMCELAKSPAKIAYYIPLIAAEPDKNSRDYLGFLINIVRCELYLRCAEHEISKRELSALASAINEMLHTYFSFEVETQNRYDNQNNDNFDMQLWSKYIAYREGEYGEEEKIASNIGKNFSRWNFNRVADLINYRKQQLSKGNGNTDYIF